MPERGWMVGRAVLLVPLLLGVSATQAAAQRQSAFSTQVITADDVARSRATTAWEALRRVVPFISMTTTRAGTPGRISRRGKGSLIKATQPLIILDGIRISELSILTTIPAEQIVRIRVVSGIDGTTLYGTDTTQGVIFIETRGG